MNKKLLLIAAVLLIAGLVAANQNFVRKVLITVNDPNAFEIVDTGNVQSFNVNTLTKTTTMQNLVANTYHHQIAPMIANIGSTCTDICKDLWGSPQHTDRWGCLQATTWDHTPSTCTDTTTIRNCNCQET